MLVSLLLTWLATASASNYTELTVMKLVFYSGSGCTGSITDAKYYEENTCTAEPGQYVLVSNCTDSDFAIETFTGDECLASTITNSYTIPAGTCTGVALYTGCATMLCDNGLPMDCLEVNTTRTTTTTTTTTTIPNSDNTFTYNGQTYGPGSTFTFFGSDYAAAGDYVFTGVATTLSSSVSAGDSVLPVVTQLGFKINDLILIGLVEFKKITGFSSINIATGLDSGHGAGTPVVQVVAAAAGAGGDPIAMYGDVRREFWLPLGILHPILHMPEMNIHASTFPGRDHEQWFERMVITSPGGFKIADIAIKRDIADFNKSASPPNAFETLDVRLGTSEKLMEHMPAPDFFFHRNGVHLSFMRMGDMRQPITHQLKIQGARRDVVMVACRSAHFVITASPASEFSNFRPDLAVKFAHLGIIALHMHNPSALRGLLPELWGLKPLSNRTKSFMQTPQSQPQDTLGATPKPGIRGSSSFLPPISNRNKESSEHLEVETFHETNADAEGHQPVLGRRANSEDMEDLNWSSNATDTNALENLNVSLDWARKVQISASEVLDSCAANSTHPQACIS